jgi:hypothetical protein
MFSGYNNYSRYYYYCCFHTCMRYTAPVLLLGLVAATGMAHAYIAHTDAREHAREMRSIVRLVESTQQSIATLAQHVDDILTRVCPTSIATSSEEDEDDDDDNNNEYDSSDVQII